MHDLFRRKETTKPRSPDHMRRFMVEPVCMEEGCEEYMGKAVRGSIVGPLAWVTKHVLATGHRAGIRMWLAEEES